MVGAFLAVCCISTDFSNLFSNIPTARFVRANRRYVRQSEGRAFRCLTSLRFFHQFLIKNCPNLHGTSLDYNAPGCELYMVTRMWGTWQSVLAKFLLLRPTSTITANSLPRQLLWQPSDWEGLGVPPYAGLSQYWYEFGLYDKADYPSFLRLISRCRGIKLQSILELACGNGLMTACLARLPAEVVGLDLSNPMLDRARERYSNQPNITFVCGDFHAFELGRQFDAAVCAGDSLNYVGSVAELNQVFRAVARHLRPGGFLAFDTVTYRGMLDLSGRYAHRDVNGHMVVIHYEFDPNAGKEISMVLMPGKFEIHHRVPIDPQDVLGAAASSGLQVDDYFSHFISIPGRPKVGPRCFFLLSRV
jgi:SAM-dependent methyltransferase